MKTKNTLFALALAALCGACCTPAEPGLKDAVGDRFLIGAAINTRISSGEDTASVAILQRHFNSVVAENCMKCEAIHPEENRYFFDEADRFVQFAEENNLAVIGHCLIWHSQCAPWFFVDDKGETVTPEVLKQRMRDHIHTIVGRYKGRVKGWDVVNETIEEDGSFRQSPFYRILGEEFIPLAFQYAHEADPEAELYINDYGMDHVGRRTTTARVVKQLLDRGLRVDAIGMQSHIGMDYPDLEAYETSLETFAALGVKVMITELDLTALPSVHHSADVSATVRPGMPAQRPTREQMDSLRNAWMTRMNPYAEGLPDSLSAAWNARMKQFFDLYLKHADVVSRVTLWGVADGDSWRNDFPIPGRTDYPLLFDRNYQPKPVVQQLIDEAKAQK